MEQQYQLKEHGNLSLFEQDSMPSEDRAWWMRRLLKDAEERKEKERGGSGPRRR